MEKKLKIAIYSGTIPSTTFIENLIKGISMKYEVLLFGKLLSKPRYTTKNIKCFPIDSNKFKTLIVTIWRTFLLLIRYPNRFKILWNQVKLHKGIYNKYQWWSRYVPVLLNLPDIFHIQWAKDLEHWMFLKQLGEKIVLSLRGAHINYSPIANSDLKAAYRKNFPKVDAFHAVCDTIGLEAQKYGADATKITTIHSLVPQNTFDLFKLPKEKIDKKLNIISVGRHHWKKGYNLALDACKLLKQKGIPFTYTIIADGTVPEELLFQRHQLELEKEVIFMGSLPQNMVFELMQENDVLLLPSLEEGIANVVLEAMAIGLPVISSNCGGMNEVVIPNETGWLVEKFDVKSLSKAIISFKNIQTLEINEIKDNAHKFVKENFESYESIYKFELLYKTVLNK